jgi:tRNA (guanine-N7-)-methyltransferase
MRARKKSWTDREIECNELIVKNPDSRRGKWAEYFNNNKPINLEVGCGKGRFIAAAARAYDDNYIGLERTATVLAQAARLARENSDTSADEGQCREPFPFAQCDRQTQFRPYPPSSEKYVNTVKHNLAYIVSNVENLGNLFAPGEITTLYINFCDPWSNKKKWRKRILTHSQFLRLYHSLGINVIMFKTDNRGLFEFSIEQFSEQNWLIKNVSLDLHSTDQDQRFITEYEMKFAAKGPIFRLEAYAHTRAGGAVSRESCGWNAPITGR